MVKALKAPFPYFGGKSSVAALVWDRLGDVDNYVECFFGSGAVLLLRPHLPKIETVNDLDSMIANFWRATQHNPEAVVEYADGPVNEVDLHARHRWLVLSDDAAAFRQRMRTDPEYYDAKVAGWFCWGLCCWIGSGWCTEPGLVGRGYGMVNQGVNSKAGGTNGAPGQDNRKPRIDGGEGQYGHGIHAKGDLSQQVPMISNPGGGTGVGAVPTLSQQIPLIGDPPRGVHRGAEGELSQQLPDIGTGSHGGRPGKGVHRSHDGNRPQLADAYSRGRGVHSHDEAGTCAQRRAWLLDWFGRLRDRLRTVRVCCGDWSRVCSSESVTTRLGITGVFLDPPYGTAAGRNMKLYSQDSGTVAGDVREWCLERGPDPRMRIALAGYALEGHEPLEAAGWECVAWQAAGGYGNRSDVGRANAKKERLWFSPHCVKPELPMFAGLEPEESHAP